MNGKLTAGKINALKAVQAGEVTYSYRSAPKIKGTRLVKAVSSEYLNKKIARGVSDNMLAKLFADELVRSIRGSFGTYAVTLSAKGTEILNALAEPVAPLTSTILDVTLAGKDELSPVLNEIAAAAVELTDARLALAQQLNDAAIAARTSASAKALADAGAFVLMGRDEEARKVLVPLRTRAALAGIKAIKTL